MAYQGRLEQGYSTSFYNDVASKGINNREIKEVMLLVMVKDIIWTSHFRINGFKIHFIQAPKIWKVIMSDIQGK